MKEIKIFVSGFKQIDLNFLISFMVFNKKCAEFKKNTILVDSKNIFCTYKNHNHEKESHTIIKLKYPENKKEFIKKIMSLDVQELTISQFIKFFKYDYLILGKE